MKMLLISKTNMKGKPIHLFVIRHSKSCSNYMRQVAGTEHRNHPLVKASQQLLDPTLSSVGKKMAIHYRPTLHQRLKDAGFDINKAIIGYSGLRRARETAQLLFPERRDAIHHLPHIKEHGNIPENTPAVARRCRPDWTAFLKHIYTMPNSQFAVVGHGSFLKSEAWTSISNKPHGRFSNLDGFLVTCILTEDGKILHPHVEEFKYQPPTYIKDAVDKCSAHIDRIVKKHINKKTRRSMRSKRITRKRS